MQDPSISPAGSTFTRDSDDLAAGRRGIRLADVGYVTLDSGDASITVTLTCDPDCIYIIRPKVAGGGSFTCHAYLTTSESGEPSGSALPCSDGSTAITSSNSGEHWTVSEAARLTITVASNDAADRIYIREVRAV